MASLGDVCRACAASERAVRVADEACWIGKYDLDSVVGGRMACSGSCGNMMACGVSAALAVQQLRGVDAARALPAGAAAFVVLSRSPVGVEPAAGIEWLVTQRRSAEVAGDRIAMWATIHGAYSLAKECDDVVGEEKTDRLACCVVVVNNQCVRLVSA